MSSRITRLIGGGLGLAALGIAAAAGGSPAWGGALVLLGCFAAGLGVHRAGRAGPA